jgi:hypothetical protein
MCRDLSPQTVEEDSLVGALPAFGLGGQAQHHAHRLLETRPAFGHVGECLFRRKRGEILAGVHVLSHVRQ